MVGLGFGAGYVAQGGDIGSFVSRVLGVTAEACKAVHRASSIPLSTSHELTVDTKYTSPSACSSRKTCRSTH